VKFCGPQDDQGGYLDSFSLNFSNSQWHIGYIKFCHYEGALRFSKRELQLPIERLFSLVISFCRSYDIGEKPNPIKRRSNPVGDYGNGPRIEVETEK